MAGSHAALLSNRLNNSMDEIQRWKLKWEYGEAEVQSLGAMLAPVRFDIGEGRSVAPMQVAPWPDDGRQHGLMRALRGEWPCLPFGMVEAPAGLPDEFDLREAGDGWVHGYAANNMWTLEQQTAHMLILQIAYPADSAIDRLERRVEADPNAPALLVSLTVLARRNVVMPFALHPTFAVPEGGVEVIACSNQSIYSYPVPPEPGISQILPNRAFASLAEVPTKNGSMNASRLPLAESTEELMQISGCQPPFILRYPGQHAEVSLDWKASELPDALLWISNGGRTQEPWLGRHFAVGVEPTNSFFDLGRVVTPPASHPLATRSGLAFKANMPRTITYRLSARAL
jgi:hypothetical protein